MSNKFGYYIVVFTFLKYNSLPLGAIRDVASSVDYLLVWTFKCMLVM